MSSFRWIARRIVLAIHAAQLAEHGGVAGVRDEGLLGSALARPEDKAYHDERDATALAAAIACGSAGDHPFLDGNKRTAFGTMELFLMKSGSTLAMTDEDAVLTFPSLEAGEPPEEDLGAWIRRSMVPLEA